MHCHPILKSSAIKDRIPKKVSLIRQDHSEIGFVLYFHLYLIVKTKLHQFTFTINFVQCSQVHNFNTKLASCGDLFLERKDTFQYGIRSIEYNGARLWNMLPAVNLRASSSPLVFRSNIKKNIFVCLLFVNLKAHVDCVFV